VRSLRRSGAQTLGRDGTGWEGKGRGSPFIDILGILVALVNALLGVAGYAVVALMPSWH
jgi:hypothetical protein